MAKPEEIRGKIVKNFTEILANSKESQIAGISGNNSFGHTASGVIEDWTVEKLNAMNQNFHAFFPEILLETLFNKIGKNRKKIQDCLDQCWWSCWLGTKRYVEDFLKGKKLERSQQDGADILLFYGQDIVKDINSIILINAKSHNLSRQSRPPNIISCKRLLDDFYCLLYSPHYEKWFPQVNYWFISSSWEFQTKAQVKEIHIKDLFKLDLEKSSGLTINFDAAIQLQCHVNSMIENKQTKKDFMKNFSMKYLDDWKSFAKRRAGTNTKMVELILKKT